MPFTTPLQLSSQDISRVGTIKLMSLGSQGVGRDGAVYRYGLAGAVQLAVGKITMQPAVVAQHQNISVATATVIGDRQVNVTLGTTAATTDQYADGVVGVYDGTGAGQRMQVVTNPTIALSTSGIFVLDDPIAIALATTSKVNLSLNPYAGALIFDHTSTTFTCNGVPVTTIPIANYGWFQTKGLAQVLTNGTITKGAGVIAGATTDGSVDTEASGTVTQRIGQQYETGTSTKYSTVYLTVE